MPEADHEVFAEKLYAPEELATLWNLSVDTIRRIFADEPGVLVWERPGRSKNARPYKTVRIPASVARRVYEKLCVKARVLNPTHGVRPAAALQSVESKHSVVDYQKYDQPKK